MKRSASSASVEDPANQVIIIFSMFLETTVEFHYLKLWILKSLYLKLWVLESHYLKLCVFGISFSYTLNFGILLSQTLMNSKRGYFVVEINFMYLGYLKYSVNQNGLFSLSGHRPHSWFCITTLRYNLWPLLWDCKVMLFCRLSVMFINKEWIRCGLSAMRNISMV